MKQKKISNFNKFCMLMIVLNLDIPSILIYQTSMGVAVNSYKTNCSIRY